MVNLIFSKNTTNCSTPCSTKNILPAGIQSPAAGGSGSREKGICFLRSPTAGLCHFKSVEKSETLFQNATDGVTVRTVAAAQIGTAPEEEEAVSIVAVRSG